MFNCKNLLIILISVYLITSILKEDIHKLIVGGITLYLLMNNIEGLKNSENPEKKSNDLTLPDKSNINMGPYDGLCLKTGNNEYWMKSPDETSLVPNNKLYTYLSSQGPIKMKLSDQSALKGPPIDGVKGSDEKMFMLANNISSPLCCPSTFSTSTGCLCTTKNQRDFVASRGYLDEEVSVIDSVDKALI